MSQSETIDLLATALCKAQSAMTAAVVNKTNPHFKSKYADLASVIEAIRKPLAANGLAFTQTIWFEGASEYHLQTTLLHTSGQWVRSEYPLPTNATPQAMGSALTYARRYSLSAITGIAADEDDDGDSATSPTQKIPLPKSSLEQSKKIGPHEILMPPRPQREDWNAFGLALLGAINGAKDETEAKAWKDANQRWLDQMASKQFTWPEIAERLELALLKIGPKQ